MVKASAIFLLGLLLAPALAGADGPYIRSLQIRGARVTGDLETRAGKVLDLGRVERDVRRLWATGRFDDIRVEASESPKGTDLTFVLVERPRLYLRRAKFEPRSQRYPIRLRKGSLVDAVIVARLAGDLRRRLIEEGYADARVEADVIPVGIHGAEVRFRIARGRLYRFEAVRFQGAPGLSPEELRKALASTRPRRLLPSLGPLWKGWRLLEPYGEERLQSDVERLRSFYFSRGFFDARVEVARVTIAGGKATAILDLNSGRRYHIQRLEIPQAGLREEVTAHSGETGLTRQLCDCLWKARANSEKRGELGFSAALHVKPGSDTSSHDPEEGKPRMGPASPSLLVNLEVSIETGPAFHVGRIEFRGHRRVSDSALRRALVLREGELFDQSRLRRSLARLNRLGLIEPLTISDVRVEPAHDTRTVNLTIPAIDKPRGYWALSGPLASVDLFSAGQFSIGSRLPSLGRGPLELATYNATFSVLAWPSSIGGVVPLGGGARWRSLVALERPYMPGQRWESGFLLSPQGGWQWTLANYGLTQFFQAVRDAARSDAASESGISVPVSWRTSKPEASALASGVFECDEARHSWLRTAAATLARFATGRAS